ncbi:septum formation inhibitor Maf [Christiangramia aestuarii]|uniref:Septum formation inhibitor Maf n=1 Tax=Christiangramia aestuarii TaxID=1028746 RepID=A0A7K1LQ81_9FLAO|nr:septum formation inhibitor Maf [Christiangramia aestuarii]MUP42964.1 septum formation inhibitor Maf [Christiangramia aestuarii]
MYRHLVFVLLIIFCFSCNSQKGKVQELQLSEKFKDYWYSGEAEITSYELEQARYGEMRKGEAVLIFVTEDFLPKEQVKANSQNKKNISVLKLNSTKNFVTGIYPYSIMQSSFYPLNGQEHALKISASIQEWCGQVYTQLNNRENYEISSHSYFQGEADQQLSLEKAELENEVWNRLRIDPDKLPVGEFKMIPSLEYLRLSHQPIKEYTVSGEFYTVDELNVYMLEYPELKRKLKIFYQPYFPFGIEKWEETYPSGFEDDQKLLTTSAVKKQRIKSDYWNKNSNKNLPLREKLELN